MCLDQLKQNSTSYIETVLYSLTQVIDRFAQHLESWLKIALEDAPLILQEAKVDRKLAYLSL